MTLRPERTYEKSVFINCPYDPGFADLFHALIFTVVAHGFVPRSAKESEGEAEARIDRIVAAFADSKYSIHDLSRFTGEGVDNFARFNMPLELGIAIGMRHAGRKSGRIHNWQVMVAGGYAYQRFASDLAGFDPSMHDMTVPSIVRVASSWLRRQPEVSNPAPSARSVLSAYGTFQDQVESLRHEALEEARCDGYYGAGVGTSSNAPLVRAIHHHRTDTIWPDILGCLSNFAAAVDSISTSSQQDLT